MMQSLYCASFADAIGKFVALEAAAAMHDPSKMLGTEGLFGEQERGWSGVAFDDHLNGMLGDLIDLCSVNVSTKEAIGKDFAGACVLYVVPHANQTPDSHEWQWAMCGYVRIESTE